MAEESGRRSRSGTALTLAGVAVALLLLMARRSDQIFDPQVWDEDGTQMIPSILEHGLRAFLVPVNGYYILTGKLISFVALKLGGLPHFPGVSTALGMILTAALLAWIGYAPLVIRGGALLAIAVALVPTDTEVFVVPLYTFWFAGLALFTLVLWQPADRSRVAGRVGIALLGGLSNPIVIFLAPLAVARVLWFRARHELLPTLAMVGAAGLQLSLLQLYGSAATSLPPLGMVALVYARFLAWPLTLGFAPFTTAQVTVAFAAVHVVAICALLAPAESRGRRAALVGLFGLSALSSILRWPMPTILHPTLAGPRYFFFPFICLLWLWIDALLTIRQPALKLVPFALLGLALHSTSKVFNRHHPHLDWAGAARVFAATGKASFPVHYDGNLEHQWVLKLAPCATGTCQVN